MADNRVKATYLIRHDIAANWTTRNPILLAGEFGLEDNTYLIKVGNGVSDWAHLPYLNKLDASYFKTLQDGTITFSDEFVEDIEALKAAAGQAIEHLTITDPPVNPTDVPNKQYVDDAIAAAGHLKREVVLALPEQDIDENTMYMVLAQSGDHYEEYMYINGTWDMVGVTGDGGNSGGFELQVATRARLGGVKASGDPDKIDVTQEGFMTLNQVSTSLLYVPDGDTLILYGGSA